MIPSTVYKKDISFDISEIENRKEPNSVLLCSPTYFDIVDEKNVHMQGNIGNTDKEAVHQQWHALKNTYDNLKSQNVLKEISVIEGAEGCEDMVFCANQSFPYTLKNGEKVVVMSNMRHPSRQREVEYFEKFFAGKNFQPLHFKGKYYFEGMGDVIPHPSKHLLYGGYGHRTSADAYMELATMLDVPVIALELVSPKFYHLDTCFVPLSIDTVMLCEEAFSIEGLNMIKQLFKIVYSIPASEAEQYFSLNAHVLNIDGQKIAILQKGSSKTKQVLTKEGFDVIELETSEFMKSGGSVFCMKMMY